MSSIWDFVDSINNTKTDLMVDTENDEAAESSYSPFMINRALSYFPDTVILANDMNERSGIPNREQYLYLLGSVSKRKRFSKWAKSKKSDELDSIMDFYGCSHRKALEYQPLLNEEQKQIIMEAFKKQDEFKRSKGK